MCSPSPGDVARRLPSTSGGAPMSCGIGKLGRHMRMIQPGDGAARLDMRMFEEAGVAVELLVHDPFGGEPIGPVGERLDASNGRSTALISAAWS